MAATALIFGCVTPAQAEDRPHLEADRTEALGTCAVAFNERDTWNPRTPTQNAQNTLDALWFVAAAFNSLPADQVAEKMDAFLETQTAKKKAKIGFFNNWLQYDCVQRWPESSRKRVITLPADRFVRATICYTVLSAVANAADMARAQEMIGSITDLAARIEPEVAKAKLQAHGYSEPAMINRLFQSRLVEAGRMGNYNAVFEACRKAYA